ncbi:MAG: hypothetical protein ACM3P1_04845 [Candidatus Saccharibacteria bacterium]
MDKEIDIPLPVRFNPLKHHRKYILRLLQNASSEMITDLLDPVCNNYIDLYTGSLTSIEIAQEVIAVLKSMGVLDAEKFIPWVEANHGYRKITLSDHSEWIVRPGNESERFVHLHPSRTGPFSVRFKGSTLKTICLLKINISGSEKTPSLAIVNRVRHQVGLSPVNKLEPGKGMLASFERFFSAE